MHAFTSSRSPGRDFWFSAAKVLGLILLVLGSKFLVLRMCSSPLPVFDQWQAEGQNLLQPWMRGELRPAALFAPWAQHRIVWSRLLALGLFQLNGQWDTQVEAIAAEVLHACTAGLLGAILIRRLGREWEDAILLCLLLLFGLPFAQEDTLSGGFASQYYALLFFGVVAIWGLASYPPWSARWWAGAGAAVCAWFSVATGGLPALGVAAWMGLRLARREGSTRENATTLGVALALGAGGLSLSIGIGQQTALHPHSVGELLVRFAGLLGWPNPTAWAAPVACAPFAWLLWRTVRSRRRTGRAEAFLIPLGIFAVLNTAALAFARNHYGGLGISRYMDFLCFGTLVNFGCVLLFLREAAQSGLPAGARMGLGALTALWVAVAGFGLSRLTAGNIADDLPFVEHCSEQEVTNVSAFVAHPDPQNFARKDPFEVLCQEPSLAASLLTDRNILQALPWQVRLPVLIEAASVSPHVYQVTPDAGNAGAAGWLLEPGHDGQPVYFRSRTISGLRLPYLRFPQISEMGSDAFVVLVNEISGKTSWLTQSAGAAGWKSALVKTPRGPFHIEAVIAAGSNRRMAFSDPREVGWLSAWVDPILDSAVGFLFAGAAVWLGAIFWKRLMAAEEAETVACDFRVLEEASLGPSGTS